ncbi:MAG: EamA family transporter [Anaerotignum sp.]
MLEKNILKAGAGALCFPVIFSMMDGLETIVTGLCLDKTFGYAMPEGDSIIIAGMEYALFALGFWIYVSYKEKHLYNPITKSNGPIIGGALCDNVALVFYAYAMAIDSVATDPVLSAYPIMAVVLSRILLKEKLSIKQYLCLACIISGTLIILVGQNFM